MPCPEELIKPGYVHEFTPEESMNYYTVSFFYFWAYEYKRMTFHYYTTRKKLNKCINRLKGGQHSRSVNGNACYFVLELEAVVKHKHPECMLQLEKHGTITIRRPA